jgi:hypothetical protein
MQGKTALTRLNNAALVRRRITETNNKTAEWANRMTRTPRNVATCESETIEWKRKLETAQLCII